MIGIKADNRRQPRFEDASCSTVLHLKDCEESLCVPVPRIVFYQTPVEERLALVTGIAQKLYGQFCSKLEADSFELVRV